MKKGLALVLVLTLMGLLLAGCGGGGASKVEEPKVLKLNLGGEPPTLDPALAQDTTSNSIIQNVFSGLVGFDKDGLPVADLAEKWTVSADGKTYTFILKKGIKFHDGRELKAEDAAFSINRALDPDLKSEVAELYLGDIVGAKDVLEGKAETASGVVVKDEKTLEITIDAPKAYFIAKLGYPTSFVVDKNQVNTGATWTDKPNGTGPFKLDTWEHNSKLVLVKNPDYHGLKAKIDRVEYVMINEVSTELVMYEAGELDVAIVPPAEFNRVSTDANLSKELLIQPRAAIFYLGLNGQAWKPFQDKKVRQAFASAVDKQTLTDVVLNKTRVPATGMLPPGMPGFNPNLKGLPFDVAKAKALLAEAGYADPKKLPPGLAIYTTTSETSKKIGEFIQGQWDQNLGVKADIVNLEWGVFLETTNKGDVAPAYFLGWIADYMDPQDFLSIMLHSKSENNRTGWISAEFDALVEKADVEPDQAKRLQMYQQAEQIAVDESPWIFLFWGKAQFLQKPYVKDILRGPMGALPLNTADIVKEAPKK